MSKLKHTIALAAILAALSFAGTGDIEHEHQQAKHYSEMVCAGHWPNYKSIEVICND